MPSKDLTKQLFLEIANLKINPDITKVKTIINAAKSLHKAGVLELTLDLTSSEKVATTDYDDPKKTTDCLVNILGYAIALDQFEVLRLLASYIKETDQLESGKRELERAQWTACRYQKLWAVQDLYKLGVKQAFDSRYNPAFGLAVAIHLYNAAIVQELLLQGYSLDEKITSDGRSALEVVNTFDGKNPKKREIINLVRSVNKFLKMLPKENSNTLEKAPTTELDIATRNFYLHTIFKKSESFLLKYLTRVIDALTKLETYPYSYEEYLKQESEEKVNEINAAGDNKDAVKAESSLVKENNQPLKEASKFYQFILDVIKQYNLHSQNDEHDSETNINYHTFIHEVVLPIYSNHDLISIFFKDNDNYKVYFEGSIIDSLSALPKIAALRNQFSTDVVDVPKSELSSCKSALFNIAGPSSQAANQEPNESKRLSK